MIPRHRERKREEKGWGVRDKEEARERNGGKERERQREGGKEQERRKGREREKGKVARRERKGAGERLRVKLVCMNSVERKRRGFRLI